MVDVNIPVPALRVQPGFLLDIYSDETYSYGTQSHNKSRHLPQKGIEGEKSQKSTTNRGCCNSQETASYTEKFKGLLQPLEYRETRRIHHCQGLKKFGRKSAMQMKATQPPTVNMMVFFTSWSPFCILK